MKKDQIRRPLLVKGSVIVVIVGGILGVAVSAYREYRTNEFYKELYLDSVKRVGYAKKCCAIIRVLGTDDERG